LSRKTYCGRPACYGTVERRELVHSKGYWSADMAICYRCTVCGWEELVDLKLSSKKKKALAKRLREAKSTALAE